MWEDNRHSQLMRCFYFYFSLRHRTQQADVVLYDSSPHTSSIKHAVECRLASRLVSCRVASSERQTKNTLKKMKFEVFRILV